MSKIGVFPAAGGLGGSIANHLSKLVPASQLILIARKPENLTEYEKLGATIRKADYDSPETLKDAFKGVDTLMLISYASFEIEHRIKVHRLAIDAAIVSGVNHIFYSSLAFAGLTDTSVAHVMGAHLQTEAYLSSLTDKISFTVVREGIYSESYPIYTSWFDPSSPNNEITIPHNGSGPGVAWVKRDELGEATARLITSYVKNPAQFKYRNEKLLLTGQKEYSLAETVAILGRVLGRDLSIREISIDDYVKLEHGGLHTYHGVDLSREWATAWEAIRRGETAAITEDIKEILEREPEEYEVTIRKLIG
ncbi:hypothetical protein N7448_010068 [Penicillium atrosanguineum]|uniref:NmrA-like domain-containing protein n=1 Tax=Penicillium atrosanguineum TaxID=1132637 RepID=A0A9W9TYT9_9EURO|nr:polyketide synthase [Penicillium atrosanguineum]KAJ5118360.1 hypothetical protein N7526_009997 [Penicillium atrosanguineum]KAJ5119399.1 hypothetical protein N7448_010068 [Penicillium atrosanguineum]KAJ5296393.1 polyketide synthase [Penicillium atrosanguineum]KAJ5299162.1 hypothetical protein N7476_010719 [Penicillium atrosanguineum]